MSLLLTLLIIGEHLDETFFFIITTNPKGESFWIEVSELSINI